MTANRSSILPSFRIVLLSLLGICMTGSAFARIWTMKDGRELEANFVKYDAATKTLTVNAGGKEELIALTDLIYEDRKRLIERTHADIAPASPEVAKDEIFSLLGKSTADVAIALKNLKLVENMESVIIEKIRDSKDTMDGFDHSYDNEKISLRFYNDKLYTISLYLMNGYAGRLPLGLKKSMTQKVSGDRLESLGFQTISWGHSDPGWGVARALDASPEKIVAIMTMQPDSPELSVVRVKMDL